MEFNNLFGTNLNANNSKHSCFNVNNYSQSDNCYTNNFDIIMSNSSPAAQKENTRNHTQTQFFPSKRRFSEINNINQMKNQLENTL